MSSQLSEVTIQSPDARAADAIREHHAHLRAEFVKLVGELRSAVASGGGHDKPLGELSEFLVTTLMPHALAEETTLYEKAATDERAALLVESMLLEHGELQSRVSGLPVARTPLDALSLVEGALAVFAVHLVKENDLLLPALDRMDGVSVAALLEVMEPRFAELVAQAKKEFAAGRGTAGGAAREELDVRALPHSGRHEAIFGRLDALNAGDTLVITNDHDPKPLRYQMDAAWPETFAWEYEESGPPRWRVAITRVRAGV